MQHQSCLLGIPSMQLELPMHVRQKFNVSETFRTKFMQGITNIYNEVIVKLWNPCKIKDNIFLNEEYFSQDQTFRFNDSE